MYLISLYFDEGTNKKIQLYMEQIAQRAGNMAMIDGKVPPHITLSAFAVMQNQFAPFTGEAVEIGLARTNPYRDLCKIKLIETEMSDV